MEELYARVLRYAIKHVPADAAVDAEDVVQAAWLKCGAMLPTLDSDTDRVKLWLWATRQIAIDHHRQAKWRSPGLLDSEFATGLAGGMNTEAAALARLELEAIVAQAAAGNQYAAAALAQGLFGTEAALVLLGTNRVTLGTRVHRFRKQREVA